MTTSSTKIENGVYLPLICDRSIPTRGLALLWKPISPPSDSEQSSAQPATIDEENWFHILLAFRESKELGTKHWEIGIGRVRLLF